MAKKMKKKPKQFEFNLNDLVAAKIRGHRTWPGWVEKIDSLNKGKRYHVKFFGSNQTGSTFVELKPFEHFTKSELSCDKEEFKLAMQLCKEEQARRSKGKIIDKKSPRKKRETVPSKIEEDELEPKAELDEKVDSEKEVLSEDAIKEEEHQKEQHELAQGDFTDNGKEKETNNNRIYSDDVDKMDVDDEKKECNETENTNLNSTDRNDCLPDSTTPDDQCQLPTGSKSDESSKDCSLNDLTSEQTNADRGTQSSKSLSNPDVKPETKKELTLAKLKKKIDEKLKEKEDKKKERTERKSFEKASKILPRFTSIFDPLAESCLKLLDNFSNKKVVHQFKTSVKNCEKHLNSLEKFLKLLTSNYGKKQKECIEFHDQMQDIAKKLKEIRDNDSDPASGDALRLLKELKKHNAIKKFINDEDFPPDSGNLTLERKENSKRSKRLTR